MVALAFSALVALGVGFFVDEQAGFATFSVLVLALLLYHLRNLRALSHWLEHREAPDPPRARGRRDNLHALLQRSRREAARREAELYGMLARCPDAAPALPTG